MVSTRIVKTRKIKVKGKAIPTVFNHVFQNGNNAITQDGNNLVFNR